MTREEAREFGNMWLQVNEDSPNSNTYKFFQMALKALEQEPILDKIRAEIKEKSFVDYDETYTDNGKCLVTEDDVLEIINKYCKGAEKWEWR